MDSIYNSSRRKWPIPIEYISVPMHLVPAENFTQILLPAFDALYDVFNKLSVRNVGTNIIEPRPSVGILKPSPTFPNLPLNGTNGVVYDGGNAGLVEEDDSCAGHCPDSDRIISHYTHVQHRVGTHLLISKSMSRSTRCSLIWSRFAQVYARGYQCGP